MVSQFALEEGWQSIFTFVFGVQRCGCSPEYLTERGITPALYDASFLVTKHKTSQPYPINNTWYTIPLHHYYLLPNTTKHHNISPCTILYLLGYKLYPLICTLTPILGGSERWKCGCVGRTAAVETSTLNSAWPITWRHYLIYIPWTSQFPVPVHCVFHHNSIT